MKDRHITLSKWLGNVPAHRQTAQALALAGLLLGLVLLPLIGLAVDVEIVLSAHRRLEMLADGAARIGAMQLDPAVSRARQRGRTSPAANGGAPDLPAAGDAATDQSRCTDICATHADNDWGHHNRDAGADASGRACRGGASGDYCAGGGACTSTD